MVRPSIAFLIAVNLLLAVRNILTLHEVDVQMRDVHLLTRQKYVLGYLDGFNAGEKYIPNTVTCTSGLDDNKSSAFVEVTTPAETQGGESEKNP